VDAAQDGLLTGEDLHRDDRVEALPGEDAVRAREVDIGGIAGQDLGRRAGAWRALEAHAVGVAPAVWVHRRRGRAAWAHRRGARAASVDEARRGESRLSQRATPRDRVATDVGGAGGCPRPGA